MISSVEETGSAARCIEMGAEDSLFKCVRAVLLRARVEASLEKTRLRDRQRGLFRKFAAQLEGHTKMLGRPFLTDAHTREGLSGAMRVEDVGARQFTSRVQPARVDSVASAG